MSDEIDTAARCRETAERLRRIADDKTAREISDQMFTLANDYERLATMLEAIDATNAAIERMSPSACASPRV